MTDRRFYISPNGERSRWMLTHVRRANHPDWIDATDWPDEKLAEFIMINSSKEPSHDSDGMVE